MVGAYIISIFFFFIKIFPEDFTKILYDLSYSFILAFFLGILLIKIPEFLTSHKKIEIIESFIKLKQYNAAKEILFDLIKTSRKTYEYFNLLGRIELEQISGKEDSNRFSVSFDYFQRALELAKRNKTSIYNNLSLWYYLKDDIENCKKLNDKILNKNPKNIIALTRKLDILEREENWDALIETFEKNVENIKKDNVVFSYYLFIYYRSIKKTTNDRKKIDFVLREAPITKNLPFLNFYNLGLMYYQENRKETLKKILDRINKLIYLENLNENQRDNLKKWDSLTDTNI